MHQILRVEDTGRRDRIPDRVGHSAWKVFVEGAVPEICVLLPHAAVRMTVAAPMARRISGVVML
jgi:hypothetical protein